jgi:hypothetical protein
MLNLLLNIITMSNLIFLIHVRLSIHVHPLLRRSSVLPLPACRQRRRGGRGPRPSLLPHRAWRRARGARDTPPRRGKREAARWWTEFGAGYAWSRGTRARDETSGASPGWPERGHDLGGHGGRRHGEGGASMLRWTATA